MDAQPYLKEIGRTRGLGYGAALRMFDALFGGGFADLELGAILTALRMKGESPDEVRAAIDALAPRLARVPVDVARPVVAIPSYRGTRHGANLVPLLACLLADAGVQVVVHGSGPEPGRTTTAEVAQAMGLGPAGSVEAAGAAIARGDPAFVTVDLLSPRLAALLALRRRLGVGNVGQLLATLLDPTDAPGCLRLASSSDPEAARLRRAYFESTGRAALMARGAEGEVVVDAGEGAPIDWIHDGRRDVLVPAREVAPCERPALPDARDAPATARWIQSVLAGERPVPAPIERQVAAVLHALGARSRARAATA